MILSAHQPILLPYLGFFSKMKQVDVFVLMDRYHTNFGDKNKFDNRNRIRIAGPKQYQWITVPCIHTGKQQIFSEVKIDNSRPWKKKMLRAIEVAYSKAPYFKKYFTSLSRMIKFDHAYLSDLNIKLIKRIKEWLDIKTFIYTQSRPPSGIEASDTIFLSGTPSEKIVRLCEIYKVDRFLFGSDGKKYADMDLFEREGIQVLFQEYKHPEYKQVYEPFVRYMSVMDALFNLGDKTKELI